MKLVPLIGYRKVDHEETKYAGNWDDNIKKLWALVSYDVEIGKQMGRNPDTGSYELMGESRIERRTSEFVVKSRGMFDFCGGVMFMSPQVQHFSDGNWGNSGFCSPGSCASIDCSWPALAEPDRTIDLGEYTGQTVWTTDEIDKYGELCIAEACLAELLTRGTNGWMCTDCLGGRMNRVHDLMCAYKERDTGVGHAVTPNMISKDYVGKGAMGRLNTYKVTARGHTQNEWYNSNSGNDVAIFTGEIAHKFSGEGDGNMEIECPSCGEYHDLECCNECHNCGYEFDGCGRDEGPSIDLSGQVGRALNNPLYAQQARRYDWSNG